MLVGETSAGKTVLLYNLAYHLATGKEFLGFTPRTGFKVLYVDFEGNDETRVLTMEAIGTDDEHWHVVVPLAHFYELAPGDRGPELIQRLRATLRRCNYQVVVVDSLMEAYPVEDENNNDQANAQMVAFRRVAVETGAAIVLVHNTGLKKKNDRNPQKKGLARGASSRVDRADIVLNYTAKTEEERVLTIAKTRWNNLNEQVLLRFNENLGYEVVSSSAVSETAITKMCSEALSLMKEALKQGRIEVTRNSMMEYLGIAEKTARSIALDRALRRLFNSGAITKPRKGVYSLAISISG
jgi:KaiC/GvpD/RAD55 family RecA-like ATPase